MVKSDLCSYLIHARALPMYPAAVRSYMNRLEAVRDGSADPGPLPNDHHILADMDDDEEEADEAPPLVSIPPVVPVPVPVFPGASPGVPGPAAVGLGGVQQFVMTPELMLQFMSTFAPAVARSAGGLVSSDTSVVLSKLEKSLLEARKKVDQLVYFDPIVLSDMHCNKLRQASVSGRTETQISNGVYVSTGAAVEVERSTAFHPKHFLEGLLYWFELLSKSADAAVRALLPDRLEWARRVWSHQATDVGKVMYAKRFMSEFPKETNWVHIYRTDNALMNQYLSSGSRFGYDGLALASPSPFVPGLRVGGGYGRTGRGSVPPGSPGVVGSSNGNEVARVAARVAARVVAAPTRSCSATPEWTPVMASVPSCRAATTTRAPCIQTSSTRPRNAWQSLAPGTRRRRTRPRRRVATSRMVRQHHRPIYLSSARAARSPIPWLLPQLTSDPPAYPRRSIPFLISYLSLYPRPSVGRHHAHH